jgi:hypothetical protein
MALKTYLVRAKGVCYYVAQVRAESPKAAVLEAALEVESQDWYRENDTFLDNCDDFEDFRCIKKEDTDIQFDW